MQRFEALSVRVKNWVATLGTTSIKPEAFVQNQLVVVRASIQKQQPDRARVQLATVDGFLAMLGPALRAEAFVGARLETQLDEQGRAFLGQREKNRVEAATRTLRLSPIFKWFAGDFESAAGTVAKFVTPFFPLETQRALADGGFKIEFTDYDWSLNEQAKK